ncbi:hypothetical protein COT98_04460 [Candidatus Falkowbacteria bacterium CG10_big_fil_rev_8_21_14_0_10_39_9]|uniref:Uncharacterized protein n=1 Tax=Candidatus Falkowbacteria bacterium CG10_big_fil_rev_8_21_14_0_10_39_9 TaxID=1974566 RepID=A0A2M6WNH9_9BACT|nr:MAG: hypothetical protein COT98_04460 [Candidatus Falkowbacteria bacterium CG10_big_fil_rev_8_21_14_0_10_39_9]
MATKKVTPARTKFVKKAFKAKVIRAKKSPAVIDYSPSVNFPVKSFMIISLIVFVFAGSFLIWWSFINSGASSSDSNAWIYYRHKYDKYQSNGCGGDPLITMPQCPR